MWTTCASAETAFIGMHAEREADLRFHSIAARLSHLNEWCLAAGIDLSQAVFPRAGRIDFRPPDPIVLARTQRATIAVTFDFHGERDREIGDPFRLELAQRAWLSVAPRRRWHYDDFDQLLMQARWFFSFAAGAQDQLLELRAEATVIERHGGPRGIRLVRFRAPIWIVFSPPRLHTPERRTVEDMLFSLRDLPKTDLLRPLTRWLGLCRKLGMDAVFGPYFAALAQGAMYSDMRFLTFAQIVEAYHARRRPPVTFQARIHELVESMPRQLRRQIPSSFAEEVKHTRNYETHRDETSRRKAATGSRLYALTELVKLTFEAAILRELGFSQREIAQLVDRNRRVGGWFRRALEILGETTPGR
jgi:hypothetical protein